MWQPLFAHMFERCVFQKKRGWYKNKQRSPQKKATLSSFECLKVSNHFMLLIFTSGDSYRVPVQRKLIIMIAKAKLALRTRMATLQFYHILFNKLPVLSQLCLSIIYLFDLKSLLHLKDYKNPKHIADVAKKIQIFSSIWSSGKATKTLQTIASTISTITCTIWRFCSLLQSNK